MDSIKISWQSGWLSSVITILLIYSYFMRAIIFLGKMMFIQSTNLYDSLTSTYDSNEFLENLESQIHSFVPEGIEIDLKEKVADLASLISENLGKLFSSTLEHNIFFLLGHTFNVLFLKRRKQMEKSNYFSKSASRYL
jgi:predicted PurR-regulated permease PerM